MERKTKKLMANCLRRIAKILDPDKSPLPTASEEDLSDLSFVNKNANWQMNACVGMNGAGEFSYFEGYENNVKLICHYILQNKAQNVDTFIYPFFYGIRHVIELKLKRILFLSDKVDSFQYKDITHSISNLWKDLDSKVLKIDTRLKNHYIKSSFAINELSKLDDSGQVFRYRIDSKGNLNLKNVSTINLWDAYKLFSPVFKNLGEMIDLLQNILLDEIPFQKKVITKFKKYNEECSYHFLWKVFHVINANYQYKNEKKLDLLLKKQLRTGNNKINKSKDLLKESFLWKYSLNDSNQMSLLVRKIGKYMKRFEMLQNQGSSNPLGIDFFSINPAALLAKSPLKLSLESDLKKERKETLDFMTSLAFIGLHENDYNFYSYDNILEKPEDFLECDMNEVEYLMSLGSIFDCIKRGYHILNMRFIFSYAEEKFKFV